MTPVSLRDDVAYAAALQPDGRIVVVGMSEGFYTSSEFVLARYGADGRLDSTFGQSGLVVTHFEPHSEGAALAVAVDSGGRIVTGGWSDRHLALARYLSDGRLDSSFSSDGKVLTDFGRGDAARSVAIQPDGRIVAAGVSFSPPKERVQYGRFLLVRYTPSGALDPAFGSKGKVVTSFGAKIGAGINAIALQADGKIVAAGNKEEKNKPSLIVLARYLANGALDPAFGRDGTVITGLGEESGTANGVAIDRAGRIVVAGQSLSYRGWGHIALLRYESDGRLDTTFGSGGQVFTDIDPLQAPSATNLVIQPDGKIVVTGWTSDDRSDVVVARYLLDGSLDPSFGSDGKVLTSFVVPQAQETSQGAWGLVLQNDAKIVVAGYVGRKLAYDETYDFALARYGSDGALDAAFGIAGATVTDFGRALTRLASLSATRTKAGVVVRWRTSWEVGARGFHVWVKKGRLARITRKLIRAKGSADRGAVYSFLDRRAPRSARRYWLEEMRRDGSHALVGPAVVK